MTGGNKMKRGKDLEAEGSKGESGLLDRQVESLRCRGPLGRSRRLRAGPELLQAPAVRKFLLLPRLCQHGQSQWGAAFSPPYRPGQGDVWGDVCRLPEEASAGPGAEPGSPLGIRVTLGKSLSLPEPGCLRAHAAYKEGGESPWKAQARQSK